MSILTLVEISKDGPVLREDTFDLIRLKVGSRKVVPIATCGKFRQGKSFLANIIKKRLENPKSLEDVNGIIGGQEGIEFRRGQDAHTMGIHVWSEVFEEEFEGEKVAVILLDTQGTFDTRHDYKVSAQIFCISNLMVSTQIFNVKDMISGQEIEALQLFVKHCSELDQRSGQNFFFLIRDFVGEEDNYAYGEDAAYFERVLEEVMNAPDLAAAMNDLRESFNSLTCFTIPRPADAVLRASGAMKIGDCGQHFMRIMRVFADHVVKTMEPKKIMDQYADGPAYFAHFKNVVQNIRHGRMNEIRNAYQATSELSLQAKYTAGMEVFTRKITVFPHFDTRPSEYRTTLNNAVETGMQAYDEIRGFGAMETLESRRDSFQQRLEERVTDLYKNHKQKYIYGQLLNMLVTLREQYSAKIAPNGLARLHGCKDLDAKHYQLLEEAKNSFDEQAKELNDDNDENIAQEIAERKTQLLKGIEATFSLLKSQNDSVLVMSTCKKRIDEAMQYYDAKMRDAIADIANNDQLVNTNNDAVQSTKGLFDDEMEDLKENHNFDPAIVEVAEHFKDVVFEKEIANRQYHALARAQEALRSQGMEKELNTMNGRIQGLQSELNNSRKKKSGMCSIQ